MATNSEDKRRRLYLYMREAAADLEAADEKRRRAHRHLLMFAAAIFVIGLGLSFVLMRKDDGMRCAEMGYDEWQEEVCVQWETREGVRTRPIK